MSSNNHGQRSNTTRSRTEYRSEVSHIMTKKVKVTYKFKIDILQFFYFKASWLYVKIKCQGQMLNIKVNGQGYIFCVIVAILILNDTLLNVHLSFDTL